MQSTERRRFHMSDAIVLVAAVAVSLSADRAVRWLWSTHDPAASYSQRETIGATLPLGLASISLILLCSVIIRDRGRLALGAPGLLVHVSVLFVLIVRIIVWAISTLRYIIFYHQAGFDVNRWAVEVIYYLRGFLTRDAVIAILISWLTLKIVGRWSPEKAWDDRLGRFVGVLWVVYYLGADLFLFFI